MSREQRKVRRAVCPSCQRPLPASIVGKTPLAQALHAKRIAAGYTTRTAARAAGVSHATYYRAEAGRTPDVVTFAALCKWLGKPMEDMLTSRTKTRGAPR